MSEFPFPYSLEFYNSCENQYNPYAFILNSYEYFNKNYFSNDLDFAPQSFQSNEQPSNLENCISSLLEISTQQNQEINEMCNSYSCNNSNQSFQNNQDLNSLQN